MTAAINIQLIPTPIMWISSTVTPPPPADTGLAADPTGNPIIADGAGILQPDQ